MSDISRSHGQDAFGENPSLYHSARPEYPARIFDMLQERCGLRSGTQTLEIGPGTGIATGKLLQLGANPLIAVEPDARLADFLSRSLARGNPQLKIRVSTFEDVRLGSGSFQLITCASAFHWLDEMPSLRKIALLLRPGGCWAVWWNVFFHPSRNDDFHRFTKDLLTDLPRSPNWGSSDRPPFALDSERRTANMQSTGAFENIEFESMSWTVVFDTDRLIRLYETFSPVGRLDKRAKATLLESLSVVAVREFDNRVPLQITTAIYTAKRKAGMQ